MLRTRILILHHGLELTGTITSYHHHFSDKDLSVFITRHHKSFLANVGSELVCGEPGEFTLQLRDDNGPILGTTTLKDKLNHVVLWRRFQNGNQPIAIFEDSHMKTLHTPNWSAVSDEACFCNSSSSGRV